jgi:hypothetical protein
MAWLGRIGTIGGLIWLLLVVGPSPLGGQEPMDDPSAAAGIRHEKSEYAGTWDYNAEESINIQTGRPEQRPRSATQRGGATPGVLSPARGGGGRGGGGGGGTSGAGGGDPGGGFSGGGPRLGPTPEMLRESRDMARDLLEVSERLVIAVAEDRVTITDDLERERTYFTDGRKEKHQIAASRFDVRTEWRESQLRQYIEGAYDFRMSQTYFLSPDGRRLFLMVRVGEPRRNTPQTGFNRVYDRVN